MWHHIQMYVFLFWPCSAHLLTSIKKCVWNFEESRKIWNNWCVERATDLKWALTSNHTVCKTRLYLILHYRSGSTIADYSIRATAINDAETEAVRRGIFSDLSGIYPMIFDSKTVLHILKKKFKRPFLKICHITIIFHVWKNHCEYMIV